MYDLWFTGKTNTDLWLSTPGFSNGVVRAAKFTQGGGEGSAVVDVVELDMQGSLADLDAKIADLEAALRAGEYGHEQYLQYRESAGGPQWRSRVLGGWLEPGSMDTRQTGGQVLYAHIRRANRWESPTLRQCPLINGSGASGTDGTMLTVYNHNDATIGHDNWAADDLTDPNIPATNERKPLLLTMEAYDPANTLPLTIYAGHWCSWGALMVATTLEGEGGGARGGATGTPTSSASSSDGMYLNLAWSGTAETEIWYGDLANALSLLGSPYKLMLRLSDVISETLWYRWRVYVSDAAGEHLAAESESRLMETNSECIEGPSMDLPPWQVLSSSTPLTLRFVLAVRAAAAGAHALKLDLLTLLPLEGWRIYRPLDTQRTLKIIDDGYLGTVQNDYGLASHSVEGPGVDFRWGSLGTNYLFIVTRRNADGSIRWPIDFRLKVKIEARDSRRML